MYFDFYFVVVLLIASFLVPASECVCAVSDIMYNMWEICIRQIYFAMRKYWNSNLLPKLITTNRVGYQNTNGTQLRTSTVVDGNKTWISVSHLGTTKYAAI